MYLNPYPLLEQALLSDNPDEKGKLTQALFAQLGEAEGLRAEASKPVDCRFAGHPSVRVWLRLRRLRRAR